MPEVSSAAQVKEQMANRVVVLGQVERVAMPKGVGTAIVLDDDTTLYVTYGEPPAGWAPLLGHRVRVEGLLRPSLTDSEPSLIAPHLRSPSTPKKEDRALKTLIDHRVRLSGLARDAKGGAVLMLAEQPIYLAGLDAWPTELQGKPVAVGGTLVSKQFLPVAERNAKGEVSQGTTGPGKQLVLENPVFRALGETK